MPSRIVTTAYRPKRPPPKRKAIPLQGPAIVRKAKPGGDGADPETKPAPPAAKPAIVTAISRKQAKLLRADQTAPAADEDPEATARVKAFFARMMRPP